MNNAEQPAYPITDGDSVAIGVSKREYFAGLAMQGFIASYTGEDNSPSPKSAASYSVEYADALLAELEKPQQ